MDYRITECLRLKVTYGDHLVQRTCSKQGHPVQFTQSFNTSNTEDSNTSPGNLLLCSTSHSHIKKHVFLCSNSISCVLCICIGKILLFFCSPGLTVPALSASPFHPYQMLQNPSGPLLDLLQFAITFTLGNSEIDSALQNVKHKSQIY